MPFQYHPHQLIVGASKMKGNEKYQTRSEFEINFLLIPAEMKKGSGRKTVVEVNICYA